MDFFIILLVLFFLDKEGRDWIGTLYERCKSIVRSITLPTNRPARQPLLRRLGPHSQRYSMQIGDRVMTE